ncbi:hypothetical protein K32_19170 [Kaistia sp. 32K]|nr:hypothetical protein K32_19170 [Kaistia sp. 32K]
MAYWDWILAGRDTVMAIESRYAGRSRIDAGLLARIRARGVALVHVNHAFNMGAAQRIAKAAESAGFPRPKILLETHDIQAHRYGHGRLPNPITRQVDDLDRLYRDEAKIGAEADALVHISEDDVEHFRKLLPDRRHFLNRPTSRNHLKATRPNGAATIDFLFVGNAHAGNIKSIQWFTSEVLPRLSGQGLRIRIVGSIATWFRQHQPSVFEAHREIWLEEQPDLAEIYASSRAVIVPTTAGTGASIKLVEALAMGKHVVATPMAVSAFARVPGIEGAVRIAEGADEFAREMKALASLPDVPNERGLALYASHFSNECYQRTLAGILREVLG